MPENTAEIGIAMIGCGGIALANHVPGLALCPDTRIVALCDSNAAVLDAARKKTGVDSVYTDYRDVMKRDDVDAVIVATPNFLHGEISIAAARSGKHVLCEKPLAMHLAEAKTMLDEAEKAGVRHMTAFTYRFVPAMRYLSHLVAEGFLGTPWHFRANRFQDWGERNLGWRQKADLAGSGELGDMLSHRIDFGHHLLGAIREVVADTRIFIPERQGNPSDLDDWVGILARFADGPTGVLESTKLATGWGEGARSRDYCEINGSEGTLVYALERPLEILMGKPGRPGLEAVPVPEEFRKVPGSPRDIEQGDPLVTFRYDQDFEFISAIREGRPCQPSFRDGARTQAVMEAALDSVKRRAWVTVEEV